MAVLVRDDLPPGAALGNTCCACGVGHGVRPGEQWVDFNIYVSMEGFYLLCESCVREAAAALGMVDPGKADTLEAELHELQRAADELLAERDEARQLVDLIRGYDERHPVVVVGNESEQTVAEAVAALPPKPARKPRAKATA